MKKGEGGRFLGVYPTYRSRRFREAARNNIITRVPTATAINRRLRARYRSRGDTCHFFSSYYFLLLSPFLHLEPLFDSNPTFIKWPSLSYTRALSKFFFPTQSRAHCLISFSLSLRGVKIFPSRWKVRIKWHSSELQLFLLDSRRPIPDSQVSGAAGVGSRNAPVR